MLNEQLLEINGYSNDSSCENLFLTSIFDDIGSNCDTGSDGISYEELLETLPFADEFIQMVSRTFEMFSFFHSGHSLNCQRVVSSPRINICTFHPEVFSIYLEQRNKHLSSN